ncbi:hypothetical protein [Serratia symbiotica]|uniref:Uncharacterized protein n=1 Tax=Serratia symbiotica SCt-VLC TaxID=1347341 RepID=A0A068RBL6_9GAMM|nr:hypothetical protein [Serratia symbiotica]CDG47866.1 hypothetical protein SCTVLC_1147 [Serratia symbiotica SCt-VLC]
MNLIDLPEAVQVVAAETLSQIIAMNLYDRDNTLERADFIAQAFLEMYKHDSDDAINSKSYLN